MRLTIAATFFFAGCTSGPLTTTENCSGGTGDAGLAPRTSGEVCGDDGVACAAGLSCQSVDFVGGSQTADRECLAACSDAGSCGAGERCVREVCEPSCASDSDCGGRFVRRCAGADGGAGSGVCRIPVCSSDGAGCATGTCAQPLFCCPTGAPCRAPPEGVCAR